MNPHRFVSLIDEAVLVARHGRVRRVAPGRLEACGPASTIGELCLIGGDGGVLAEVAAIEQDRLVLVPIEEGTPVEIGARVTPAAGGGLVGVGDGYAGRAIDALGRPIDGGRAIRPDRRIGLRGLPAAPLDRVTPSRVFETGVRAIDGLLTLGEGQRIGIFAASGVGKTSLVEQLIEQASATRVVLCLVGERGREVEGFWRALSGRSDFTRFTVVAATSDESAAMRARGVSVALCLAEHWRDLGDHVLLVIDSISRLAMALREIGLAAGEPPTVRAYTPNVFAALPRLIERCGAVAGRGAITAIVTVLSETDDVDDPIVETMKALLDGHIVLSRTRAERGHFPAIDVPRSVSRLSARLIGTSHATAARAAAALLGTYDDAQVMIDSGIYQAGASAVIDAAISAREPLLRFLCQRRDECSPMPETVRQLILSTPPVVHHA